MATTLTTKTIMPGQFWIIEDHGAKVGTIHNGDNVFTVTFRGGLKRFDDLKELESELDITLEIKDNVKVPSRAVDMVHGYPTNWNKVYNKKLDGVVPVFTKQEKSSSYHVAGYWAVKFPNGWTQTFCPRLNTIKSYSHIGPYKTTAELAIAMRKKKSE